MSLIDKPVDAPKILVIAGPNGSGKSTITAGLPITGSYVNADDIKAMTDCSDLQAAQKAEATRELLLAKRRDLTFETVLSTSRNLAFLQRAKDAGYRIEAVFVLTRSSEVNIARVRSRAAQGGHGVPEEKIVSRYERSLANLPQLIALADRVRIVDNTGEAPELLCETQNGTATIMISRHWTQNDILRLISGS